MASSKISVECLSCMAPYELDAQRIPAHGTKMRCPKCGATFRVHADGRVTSPDEGGAPKPAPPAVPAAGPIPGPQQTNPKGAFRRKATMVGIGVGTAQPAPAVPSPYQPPTPSKIAPAKPTVPKAAIGKPPLPMPPVPKKPLGAPAAKPSVPAPTAGGVLGFGSNSGFDLLDDNDLPVRREAGGKQQAQPIAPPFPVPVPVVPPAPPTPSGALAGLDLSLDDLPVRRAPAAPSIPKRPPELDVDLPALAPAFEPQNQFEMPTPAVSQPGAASPDADLPALASPKPGGAAFGGFGEVDLPGVAPSTGAEFGGFGEVDLPAVAVSSARTNDWDLPAPKRVDELEVDLPRAKETMAAPEEEVDPFADLDLPMPKSAGPEIVDLPAPAGFGDLDLPMPAGSQARPSQLDGIFDDGLDLPMPRSDVDLPMPTGSLGELDLPTPKGPSSISPSGFGEIDLPVPGGGSVDLPQFVGAADLPMPSSDLDLPMAHPSGGLSGSIGGGATPGGMGYGDIDLGDDGMEFDAIPQADRLSGPEAARISLAPGLAAEKVFEKGRTEAARSLPHKKPIRKWPFAVVAVLLILAAVGVGLGFTPYGYFGTYFLEQYLPEAGSDQVTARVVGEAETKAASDTYADARESLRILAAQRNQTGINRALLARSLLHESLFQIRFGSDAASRDRATRIDQRLAERAYSAPGINLARAAYALAGADASGAANYLGTAAAEAPQDPYVDLVQGELALLQGDIEQAAAAFRSAAEKGGSARADWGLARALRGTGPSEELDLVMARLLEHSPGHSGGLLHRARKSVEAGDPDEALALARQAAGEREGPNVRVSDAERASAYAAAGEIEEGRGSLGAARIAYERALTADAGQVEALLGMGRILYAATRYTEALEHYQRALTAAAETPVTVADGRPAALVARLGVARAMLHTNQVQEARTGLSALLTERPEDAQVALALGEADVAAHDNEAAERNFREAVRLDPQGLSGYISLARLFHETDRTSDAVRILAVARREVAAGPELHFALGQAQMERAETAAALEEYRRALQLDPNHLAARFGFAIASRKLGHLSEAVAALAQLSRRDPNWPGLALERGLVFESQGRHDRAVDAYTRALEENPEDLDLAVRLGAAQVAAGRLEEASEILEEVLRERPNSGEAEHFKGRIAFAQGDFEGAASRFQRARDIEPTRAEFHLYVAWNALEMNELGTSIDAVNRAIELDPELADAYWIRGRIRVRTGAVQDALVDLERALELKPGRYHAYAAIGDAYEGLRRLDDAIEAYERAIEQGEDVPEWWLRLGRLRLDAGDRRAAMAALVRATDGGDAMDPVPSWLAEAHRLRADQHKQQGERQAAIQHYERFLELAPEGAIDRDAVTNQLERWQP